MYDILELNKKLVSELRDIATELNIRKPDKYKKQDLVYKILDTQAILASEGKLKSKKPADTKAKNDDTSNDSKPKRKRVKVTKVVEEKITSNIPNSEKKEEVSTPSTPEVSNKEVEKPQSEPVKKEEIKQEEVKAETEKPAAPKTKA